MTAGRHLLFIQKRPSRAGAQTSLVRLAGAIPDLRPAVLAGGEGWLTASLRQQNIPVLIADFPGPRSLGSRLMGLGIFGRSVAALADSVGIFPWAVIANDHQECPLAIAAASAMGGVPVVGILRSAAMNARDFSKYQCSRCDRLMTVGPDLQQRVAVWSGTVPTRFEEGFAEADFHPPLKPARHFPTRLLIVGTAHLAKGFTDFIEALDLVEARHPEFPHLQCDFTSEPPTRAENLLRKDRRCRFRFIGRVEDLGRVARDYGLVVHPSRAETFGMSPMETILAGVPTLASTTGAIGRIGLPPAWQFPPEDPETLAERIVALWRNWPGCGPDLFAMQEEIRRSFHIQRTAAPLRRELERIDSR